MTELTKEQIEKLDAEYPPRGDHPHRAPDGTPVGLGTWMAYFNDERTQIVKQDAVRREPRTFVSTVYLGLDHAFGGGPPLIYETMIFGGPNDQYQDRYTTREQALAGHRRAKRIAWPWLDRFVWEPLRNMRPVL